MKSERRRTIVAYGFLIPFIGTFALFWVWPIFQSMLFSLQNWRNIPPTFDSTLNWVRLASDPVFYSALWHTLAILCIQVPVMTALALILAVSLNSRHLRCSGLFRFVFFVPIVVGEVSYSAIFRLLFNGDFGAVNSLLIALGLPHPDWLNTPITAMAVVLLAVTWRWTGYNALFLLAGLQSIPRELYEAAKIDGVPRFQQFRHITLPLLQPVLAFVVAMSIFGALQLFVEPQLITRTGPAGATETLGTYIYRQGFRNFNFGYAAAIGYAVALIALFTSLGQMRYQEKRS